MTDLVERLVPDESWVLFRRVVPPTEMKRPQGGGRRRAADRECLAAGLWPRSAPGCACRTAISWSGDRGFLVVRPARDSGADSGARNR